MFREFSTVELVRSLTRHMRKRIELRKRWATMQRAKRDWAEQVFAEVEQTLLLELERRRSAQFH